MQRSFVYFSTPVAITCSQPRPLVASVRHPSDGIDPSKKGPRSEETDVSWVVRGWANWADRSKTRRAWNVPKKGHTENLVKFARRNFMVPVPRFDDFEEFNRKLAEDCQNDLNRRLRGQDGTKAKLLEEDREAMLPIPGNRFEARRVLGGKVNTLSLVRFNRNDYSVPTLYARREVILVGSLDRVKIIADMGCAPRRACHKPATDVRMMAEGG
jgi:hypothetical protein